jgi:CelD/BcsL family acetyltransferase involved in cellulose biosynthesis
MIAAEIVSDPAAMDRYRPEWTSLFESSGRELSTSFEWVRPMCDTHLKRGETFHLIVLRRDGQACGFVPLVAAKESLSGLPIVTLTPLMERYRTHSDLLIDAGDEAVVRALVDAILSLPGRWDVWRLVQVLDSNPLLAALDEAFRAAGATVVRRAEAPSFFLPLPSTFDAYLAARSSKFRNYLRRVEKKLAATGELAVVTAGAEIGFDEAFEALLAIEAASWKHAHGTAISAIPHQAAFYREMSRRMQGAERLHLTLLTRGGEPIAYNLGLVWRGQYAYLKTSYVESLKALGPSTVLRARLVARLIDERLEALDFPAEPYEWEAQWTSDHRPHQSIVVYNRTLRAKAYAWAKRLKDARRPSDAGGIAYANARDLRAPSDGE